jgi:hypothetical protein
VVVDDDDGFYLKGREAIYMSARMSMGTDITTYEHDPLV